MMEDRFLEGYRIDGNYVSEGHVPRIEIFIFRQMIVFSVKGIPVAFLRIVLFFEVFHRTLELLEGLSYCGGLVV